MKTTTVRIGVMILAVAVCVVPVAWAAEAGNGDNPPTDIGLGAASVLCSIPYGAAKVALAVLGGVMGGFTYVLSGFDMQAADAVWYTTLSGDYLVTPDHLRGKKQLRFTGVPPESVRDGHQDNP
jgi:hypothetical protein